jgi:PAS domain-containing protein
MPPETQLTTLLIDRVEARRQEIAGALAHTVIQAVDIATGQRLFDVHHPSFVLLDGALLGRDAAEVIAAFKHDGGQVFAFCGNNDAIIARLLDAGIDDCFRLPLNMRLIQRRLTSMAAIRQTAQREGERQLQQVEDKYQRLFNSANDAILIVDISSGEILDVNQRAVSWLGYAHDELIGKEIGRAHV